ncbi:hypothetical protein ACE1CI_06165 [Aerosakkonemataceae cyanobacterium BLCC-F50]|uniref:Uncharacterized protein n=1 Tax=Floridaenema flaviceps BLCC-F50 TaxID=3153642 RepID=A0ABV4XLE4_9CYAN
MVRYISINAPEGIRMVRYISINAPEGIRLCVSPDDFEVRL